jgi:hypothetical protein
MRPHKAAISKPLHHFPGNRSSRTEPQAPEPVRAPTATETATRHLPDDSNLAAVVAAWPALPEAIRAGILAMVEAASMEGGR